MTSSNSLADTEIPTGLNRIKTRHVPSSYQLSSAIHKLPQLSDSRAEASASGYGVPRPATKQKAAGEENKRLSLSSEVPKGKKVALFTSFLTKDSKKGCKDTPPPTEMDYSEVSALDKDILQNKQQMEWKDLMGKHPFPKNTHLRKIPKGLKSFSHEIGSRGGIQPAIQRAHSYNDLKELLGSLHSSFDAAKQVVNAKLVAFAGDVLKVLGKEGDLFSKSKRMAEDLLILAHQCTEMTPSEFREKCEGIVQDLVEKRQQCEAGIQKQLVTRILFILTRCTRVLLLQKSDPMDEDSLHKFKQFLESIPAIEMNWVPKSVNTTDKDDTVKSDKVLVNGGSNLLSVPVGTQFGSDQQFDKNDMAFRKNSNESCSSDSGPHIISIPQCGKVFLDHFPQCTQLDGTLPSLVQKYYSCPLKESETFTQAFDSVICRICEEVVPSSHLESHSYICAYADNCCWKGSDVDERLSKIAETLEQIIDSYPQSVNASNGSPEILRSQTSNSAVESESHSPKINEWHSKGTEGMFEDLHDMDTTCLDESHLSSNIFLKSYLNMKLGQSGAPSSTGSFTSISSTNTPRTSHFDLFWLEHNSPSELEDVTQMTDLADIARCVANTEHMTDGASKYFLACMHELHDILQRSKVKALVIDTFGVRIENLLRGKYLLACELMDENTRKNKGNGVFWDSASESRISTPFHPMTKERTSIDDFEIIKPITKGAFGKVFLARKRTTGDLFAIKVLKKLDMIRKNDVDRILSERNILITVRNPFVVRFFYSFTSRENLYLVMEYLNGGDLYSLLQKVGCLEEDVARIYVAELVLALEYLHSLGIVHRDLKPDNILIAHDGHIKLTDFGLSKIGLINNTVDLSGTQGLDYSFGNHQREDKNQQSATGTPDYLAPEILLGIEHGYVADWWSVGIILFELLIGIPPFTARFPEIIFDNILNQDIPWPNVPNDLSYEARDLISRFLIHDPNQRLGANGASEVKAHPFFSGINCDTLALQKAAFVPNPESAEDTSYFMSRYSQSSVSIPEDHYSSDSASDTPVSSSKSGSDRNMDECGEQAEFDSSTPLNISLINFSFKNLSQLASINYDVLLQSGNNSSKCSSPSKGMEP